MSINRTFAARQSRIAEVDRFQQALASATKKLDQGWKDVEDGHNDLQSKKDELANRNEGSIVSDDDILDINAGGQVIRVSRGTLTQIPGSCLEALFSGRWEKQLQRDTNGRIFLDVNPSCFSAIIDYLNRYKLASPESPPPNPPRIDSENQVILDGLLTAFSLTCPVDSTILTDNDHIASLRDFLLDDGHDTGFELLYRGTRDGMTGKSFHDKCDNNGSTVTVIKSGTYIFGGVTDQPWSRIDAYKKSKKTFLFGLNCDGGSAPKKFPITPSKERHAICGGLGHGPKFGGGHDLLITTNENNKLIFRQNRVHSYRTLPPTYFTGNVDGEVTEIEVFKLVTNNIKVNKYQAVTNSPACNPSFLHELFQGGFPDELRKQLKEEQKDLKKAFEELEDLQLAFQKEHTTVNFFCAQPDDDIVYMYVSGQAMAVKQSTLATYPDSVLYKQFADPNWTEESKNGKSPREWSSNEVSEWIKSIEGLSEDVASSFGDTNGLELLAFEREDIKDLGITRPGTLALILKSIQKLREEDEAKSATFIEHSDYCFGKIFDLMRLKAMSSLDVPDPGPPEIRQPDRKRFKAIVDYFLPKEKATDFLTSENSEDTDSS